MMEEYKANCCIIAHSLRNYQLSSCCILCWASTWLYVTVSCILLAVLERNVTSPRKYSPSESIQPFIQSVLFSLWSDRHRTDELLADRWNHHREISLMASWRVTFLTDTIRKESKVFTTLTNPCVYWENEELLQGISLRKYYYPFSAGLQTQ